MATSAWLRGPSAMRLTEGLVSVLKEQRPDYIPVLLTGYREHGVFHTQVNPELNMAISPEASYLYAAVLQASSLSRQMFGTSHLQHFRCEANGDTPKHNHHCFVVIFFRAQAPWLVSLVSAMPNLAQARPGDKKQRAQSLP